LTLYILYPCLTRYYVHPLPQFSSLAILFDTDIRTSPTITQHHFVDIIRILQSTPSPKLNPPSFIFKLSAEAATFNAKLLEENCFDLKRIIDRQHPSQLSFGSEFRSPELLEELLRHHPFWPRLMQILHHGASFPLSEISDEDRHIDLQFHADRGNHKSASMCHEAMQKLIAEDVERGFAIPLPISVLLKLPRASLAPLGCVQQFSIDALGNRISYNTQSILPRSFIAIS